MPAGRPPALKVTDEVIKAVAEMAKVGVTNEHVAQALGISQTTWYECKKKYPKLAEAYNTGQGKGIQAVADKLWECAVNGNISAMQFFLARRAGWSEKQEISQNITGSISSTHDELLDKLSPALQKKILDELNNSND